MYYRYYNRTTFEVYDLNVEDFPSIAAGLTFLFEEGYAEPTDDVEPIGVFESLF